MNAGSSLLVSEGGSSSSFEVVLNSKPTVAVDINVWSSNGFEGSVTFPASGTISFTIGNWNIPKTVTITGIDDPLVNGNQGFIEVLDPASTGDPIYNNLDPDEAFFINADDDIPGVTVDIGDGLITKEHPTTPLSNIFKIVLNSEPTADVTIGPIVSSDISEVTLAPVNITFTTAN